MDACLPQGTRGKIKPSHLAISSSLYHSYITISRGCNLKCSFCIVPSVRGEERSRNPKEILAEIRRKAAGGVGEITLLGQTVNSYRFKTSGRSNKIVDFSDLLKDIEKVKGIKWIRFMSPHPLYVNPKLIRTMAESGKICKHLHLPLQSGSSKILKLMRRGYTKEKYLDLIRSLRKAMPDMSITTDVVVGFPGETQKDFQETIDALKKAGCNRAYCFKFSARPGTAAARFEEASPVDRKTKERRHLQVLRLCEDIASVKASNFLGKIEEVMLDGDSSGHTEKNYRVLIKENGKDAKKGGFRRVLIEDTKHRKLIGSVI